MTFVNTEKEVNYKYYKVGENGVGRLTNDVTYHSLNQYGEWVPNQYAISMFVDGMTEYEEITPEEVGTIVSTVKQRKWKIF